VKVGKKVGGIKITREGPLVTVVVLLHLQKLSIQCIFINAATL
jgi:hypothetical protein